MKRIIVLVLLCVAASAYAQNGILTIEDALRIPKMKNMQEASALLRSYGYTESSDDEPFYSSEVATFWVKDCKVGHGINCISTAEVFDEFASSVSVLAGEYDRWISIQVHNRKAKDELLNQMKSLGFVKNTEDGNDFYNNESDTIYVEQIDFDFDFVTLYTLDSLGQKAPLFGTINPSTGEFEPSWEKSRITKSSFEEFITSYHQYLSEAGFNCIQNDENGYIYTNGTETLSLFTSVDNPIDTSIDSVWNGNFEFTIYHHNHWPITEDDLIEIEEDWEDTP